MDNHIDLTLDLAKLMKFTGRIAATIRQYGDHLQGQDKEASKTHLLLSNVLLHFEQLGMDIQRGDPAVLAETCRGLFNMYQFYERRNPGCTASLNLSEAKKIFEEMQTKLSSKTTCIRPRLPV